jgi:predicted GNAT family N-acyltransferase
MLRIREVAHGSEEYRSTVALRDAILRRPLGLAFTDEELEGEHDSIHLAAFEDDRLVACLVLRPLGHSRIQMRQVAVAQAWQRHGLGTRLAEFAELRAAALGYTDVVVHARDAAAAFYLRLGYARVGEPFHEVGLLHHRMHKPLSAET